LPLPKKVADIGGKGRTHKFEPCVVISEQLMPNDVLELGIPNSLQASKPNKQEISKQNTALGLVFLNSMKVEKSHFLHFQKWIPSMARKVIWPTMVKQRF